MTIGFALRKVWSYLSRRYKLYVALLLLLMVLSGVFELFSIGVIIPYMDVLLEPDKLLEYDLVVQLIDTLGISGQREIIIALTSAFLSLVVISALLKWTLMLFNLRLSTNLGAQFETEVFRHVLFQPYEVHVQQNTSDLIDSIFKTGAVTSFILSMLGLVYSSFLLLFMLSAVLYVDVVFSLSVFLTIGVIYMLIMFYTRSRLKRNGAVLAASSNARFRMVQVSLGGIRDILLGGYQDQYYRLYNGVVTRMRNAAMSNSVMTQSPRLVIEPLVIVIIAISAGYIALYGDFVSQVPLFVSMAFAAQRALPNIQSFYGNWATINAAVPKILDVFKLLDLPIDEGAQREKVHPLSFEKVLNFDQVDFRYRGTDKDVLLDVSFEIDRGEKIGLIGRTGSGKSTILDLLLGLLFPSKGDIKIDDQSMRDEIVQRWQRTVAYVPQDVFFADASIAENVAFGVKKEEIDLDRVREVLHLAQLDEMVKALPDGLNTAIGENGRRLSGGQRQRVGIARALYKQTPVLILDEATSALDVWTERNLIEKIVKNERTLILVTHRFSTLEHCDMIYVLDQGRVVAKGPYPDILEDGNMPDLKKDSDLLWEDEEDQAIPSTEMGT